MPAILYPESTVAELLISQPDGQVINQRKLNPVRGYWLGRESSCDVVIDSPKVSRRHAFVFSANGRWLACDAGSSDGLDTEAGPVRCAPLSADSWVSVGSMYLWLSGAPGKPPEWIDARADTTEAGQPPRYAKLAIEDLADAEPTTVSEVLVVTDSSGNIHLCADLSGVAATKGGGSPRITIGRANTMDLQICHPSIDPLHCVLSVGSERWSIIDAGSEAGIMWDGKRWYRKRLEEGITIPIGEFRLSMQRVVRTSAPVPPVIVHFTQTETRAPKRPSAFLHDDDDDSKLDG
jgi:pSer/pThr/pTyr-binding forkhead associated (FHA) protein